MTMLHAFFWIIVSLWTFQCLYFLRRYVMHRRLPSLVIAIACTGFPVALARELRILPRDITTLLISCGFTAGLFVAVAVLAYEMQQPRPFR